MLKKIFIRLVFVIFLVVVFAITSSGFGNLYAGIACTVFFGAAYGTKRGRRLVVTGLNKAFSKESPDRIYSIIDRLDSYPSTIEEHMANVQIASQYPGAIKSYFNKLGSLDQADSGARKDCPDDIALRAENFESYIDRLESKPDSYAEYMAILNFAFQRPEWVKYYFNKLTILEKLDSDARNVEGIIIDLEPVNGSNDQLRFLISNTSDRIFRDLKISYGLLFSVYIYSRNDDHMYPRPQRDPPLEIDVFPPGSQKIFFKEVLHIVTNHSAYEKEVAYLEFEENGHRYQESDKLWCWINIKLPGVKPLQRFSGYP